MSQVLDFNEASYGGHAESDGRRRGKLPMAELRIVANATLSPEVERDATDFWPEVSSRYSLERPAAVNPANAPERALFEILLVLGGACASVLAVYLLVPSP